MLLPPLTFFRKMLAALKIISSYEVILSIVRGITTMLDTYRWHKTDQGLASSPPLSVPAVIQSKLNCFTSPTQHMDLEADGTLATAACGSWCCVSLERVVASCLTVMRAQDAVPPPDSDWGERKEVFVNTNNKICSLSSLQILSEYEFWYFLLNSVQGI